MRPEADQDQPVETRATGRGLILRLVLLFLCLWLLGATTDDIVLPLPLAGPAVATLMPQSGS